MSITSVFKNSWGITKITFNVMKEDTELIWYPILASIFSVLFILILLVPTLIVSLLAGEAQVFGFFEYLAFFAIYFGLAFIGTFFNVCVVYTAKKRFAGGDAKFMESLKFAFSKIHLIALWSLLAASVGLLLRGLESMARKSKGIGSIVIHILRSVLSLAWAIITIFVVPAMVYDDLTPFKAIKKSISVLKKTWGESLVRHFGLGAIQGAITAAIIFPALIVGALMFLTGNIIGLGFLFLFVVILVVLVGMVFTVANAIFNTALYEYASTGNIPAGYSKDIMTYAFIEKKKKA
ncbi:hypothetical protein HOC80_03455 [archaeon]|jgi:hypothetical protein|nr:hypothetical protein [archaeon]MBT4417133.1 hypothetical protein [archaeon]